MAKPGELVWSRIFVEDGRVKMDIGRAHVADLPPAETERRRASTTPQWPIMHGVLHGVSRDQMMARHKSNHIQVVYANSAAEADLAMATKATLAAELGIEVFRLRHSGMIPSQDVLIGVDVGTGSARAGVFDATGTMLALSSHAIQTWRPLPDFVQQSSADIWAAVCASVREAMTIAGPHRVRGIGFDATCSLVVLNEKGDGVTVDPGGAPEQDVIVWMDHRASAEADRINATEHPVLRYVGGRISLEMETPKLLWLKEHLPATWRSAAHFFDLPDFLTWRATGALSRSLCSTVCKWTYVGHESRWDESFFRAAGLGELVDEGFTRIGRSVLPMGTAVGAGLSAVAAAELGLPEGTPVGASAIDAHAGGLGVIGARLDAPTDFPPPARIDRRHVELPHGRFIPPEFRARRLGTLFLRHDPRVCG